jgi:uncharacterized protein
MKRALLLTIRFYQIFFSSLLKNVFGVNRMCRFTPTCSEYAKIQIKEKGIIEGTKLSVIRLLKCQPFYKEKSYA